jgi:hypothetical protein
VHASTEAGKVIEVGVDEKHWAMIECAFRYKELG